MDNKRFRANLSYVISSSFLDTFSKIDRLIEDNKKLIEDADEEYRLANICLTALLKDALEENMPSSPSDKKLFDQIYAKL